MSELLLVLVLFQIFHYNYPQTVRYIGAASNPPHGCPNYGLCSNVTTTLYSSTNESTIYRFGCAPENCVCVDGTSNGTTPCDTIDDQCSGDPCGTGNNDCESGIKSHTCTCKAGYTGNDCNSEIGSVCGSSPCQNGGTCNSSANSTYTCNCANGFMGDNCEKKDMCYNVNCNNGKCTTVLDDSQYYCECDPGYQARHCYWSNDIPTPPVKDGCYEYNSVTIGLSKTKFSDKKMTSTLCNEYASEQTDKMNYLTLCGDWCMVSEEPLTNKTANSKDKDCTKTCGGDSKEECGKLSSRCIVWEVGEPREDPNPCEDTSLCNATTGNGVCVNLKETDANGDGYLCLCGPFWTGAECDTPLETACDPNPCINGTCILNAQFNTYTCECDPGFVGTNCDYQKACNSSTCLYGGTCTEGSNGDYSCACLSLYSGKRCNQVDRCKYNDPCVHGKCQSFVSGINPNYTCTCEDGWSGDYCDTMTNFCEPNPCQYNSTCKPKFKGYDCDCLEGLDGKNCSNIIDLCVGAWKNNKWIKSPCNTKDPDANCTKGIATFTCSCSDKWTNTLCDLNAFIRDILLAIYGRVDLDMISLLNDLMQNPSEIKDMVPFITGLLTEQERGDLSWDVGDLFDWIAFEDKRLDLNKDIHKWNDVVLGNCFTFNHMQHNFTYLLRSPGRHGGITALMKARQDEYAPWYDTSAIQVFIHNRDEYVFSESVRYNAQPNSQSSINIFTTRYTRLGGKYGKCVKKTSEVKNYYYPGAYTTDGCLRTCYQDMIMEACQCMDPRYPKADNTTSCELSERSCATDAAESAGDPSSWPSCVCPLPCSNQEYSVTWSNANFVNLPISCELSNDVTACKTQYTDNLMVSILAPKLETKIYAEAPAMDFNKFLSQLGGQLGVLMGINLVTFIEAIYTKGKSTDNATFKLMNLVNCLEIGHVFCHFFSSFFLFFPLVAIRNDVFVRIVGSALNTFWITELPMMALLAVCRIFIFQGTSRPHQIAIAARVVLVLIILWMIFVLISGCITQNFKFSPPSWQYDMSASYVQTFVDLELIVVISSLVIAYCSYLVIVYLIYLKKKRSVSANSRSNEISILIQYTFTVTYIVIYIILWHNGTDLFHFHSPGAFAMINCVWIGGAYISPVTLLIFNNSIRKECQVLLGMKRKHKISVAYLAGVT